MSAVSPEFCTMGTVLLRIVLPGTTEIFGGGIPSAALGEVTGAPINSASNSYSSLAENQGS